MSVFGKFVFEFAKERTYFGYQKKPETSDRKEYKMSAMHLAGIFIGVAGEIGGIIVYAAGRGDENKKKQWNGIIMFFTSMAAAVAICAATR